MVRREPVETHRAKLFPGGYVVMNLAGCGGTLQHIFNTAVSDMVRQKPRPTCVDCDRIFYRDATNNERLGRHARLDYGSESVLPVNDIASRVKPDCITIDPPSTIQNVGDYA